MKKIAAYLTVLLLLVSAVGAAAESIFDLLPEENSPPRRTAPSYGAMANTEPDRVEKSADGGQIVTYQNVSASGYNRFGVYLGRLGYFVTGKENSEGRTAYALSNGETDFVMVYSPETQTMKLIYPEACDFAPCLFPGYTRIECGEEISVPSLGRFTFHAFMLNGSGSTDQYKKNYYARNQKGRSIESWLSFHVYCTAKENLAFSGNSDTLFAAITLEYHNPDAVYTFSPSDGIRGTYDPENRKIIPLDSRLIAPLTEDDCAVAFDLPESLRTSADGTIAIKLEFVTGEKYVIVARENGIDLDMAQPSQGAE